MHCKHNDNASNTPNSFTLIQEKFAQHPTLSPLIELVSQLYLDKELYQQVLQNCVRRMQAAACKALIRSGQGMGRALPVSTAAYQSAPEVLTSKLLRKALTDLADDYIAGDFQKENIAPPEYVFRKCVMYMAIPVLHDEKHLQVLMHFSIPKNIGLPVCMQDALQDAVLEFIQRVRNGQYLPVKSGVSTYLGKLIHTYAFRQGRTRARQLARQYQSLDPQQLKPLYPEAEEHQRIERLNQVLNTLRPLDKKVIELFAFGYKFPEIASELGGKATADKVRIRFNRLCIRLKKYFLADIIDQPSD